jgi:hypothetical protein
VAWQSLVGGWERAPVRAYIGAGGREVSNDRTQREVLENTNAIIARLHELGISESDVKLAIDEQAAHSEEAWAKRASTALQFLFPSANGGVK